MQGCRGYGYPWIYPWIYPCVDIRLGHLVDITMDIFIYFNSNDWHHNFGINVISSCHRMGWLNTRLNYNFFRSLLLLLTNWYRLKVCAKIIFSVPVSSAGIERLFRLDALALSVIAQRRGWVAGWVAWLSHSGTVSKRLNLSDNFFRPSESPIILVFCDPCADTKFQGEPHQRGR